MRFREGCMVALSYRITSNTLERGFAVHCLLHLAAIQTLFYSKSLPSFRERSPSARGRYGFCKQII